VVLVQLFLLLNPHYLPSSSNTDGHILLSRSLAPPLCDQGSHADKSIMLKLSVILTAPKLGGHMWIN
jgi:hypothetical protein